MIGGWLVDIGRFANKGLVGRLNVGLDKTWLICFEFEVLARVETVVDFVVIKSIHKIGAISFRI